MKELMVMVSIITLILLIIFFPREDTHTYISHESEEIYGYTITIKGAVYNEGSYIFYEPLSLEDILKMSTFTKGEADLDQINLNQVFDQSTTIFIPSKYETPPMYEKININEANFQMLLEIPGMQERQAASIIIYREANGLFMSIEELINVKYIGVATLEKLKPYITL